MSQLAMPARHEWLAQDRKNGKIAIEPFDCSSSKHRVEGVLVVPATEPPPEYGLSHVQDASAAGPPCVTRSGTRKPDVALHTGPDKPTVSGVALVGWAGRHGCSGKRRRPSTPTSRPGASNW